MSGVFDDFETDKTVEKEGVWVDYGDYKIRIARAGGANKAYEICLANKSKPYRKQIQNGSMDIARQKELVKEAYIETIVLDWENITERDGTPIPFNKANVKGLFNRVPDLWEDLMTQAQDLALFKLDISEESAKNL